MARCPITVLLGARQMGKTHLFRGFASSPDHYFDLTQVSYSARVSPVNPRSSRKRHYKIDHGFISVFVAGQSTFQSTPRMRKIWACSASGTLGLRTMMTRPSAKGRRVETREWVLRMRRIVFHFLLQGPDLALDSFRFCYTSMYRLFGVHWKVEAASRRLSNGKAAGRRFHYNIPKTSRGEV